MKIGNINKILTSSFVDGPGNRAVIFLQGCNFQCLYCHNPYTINDCIHCGLCVEHCPSNALELVAGKVRWIQDHCTECDTCIQVCPYFSSPKVRMMTSDEVWQELDPVKPFLSGVSVSGGEPLLQIPFLIDFFKQVHDHSKLTTLIETNGNAAESELRSILPYVDLVQVDLKCIDDEMHLKLTGSSLQMVKQSIQFFHEHDKLYSVQQVIVDDFSASAEMVRRTADFLASIDPSIRLRLVKFRPHGTKGEALEWQTPSDDLMEYFKNITLSCGLRNVVISM